MKKRATLFFLLAYTLLGYANSFAQQTAMQYRHPLDPLDSVEIKLIKQVLLQENKIRADSSSLFSIINLKEPPKAEVLAYKPGETFRREGYAMVYDFPSNTLAKAVVDLKTGKLLSFDKIPGKQPVGSFKGDTIVSEIVKNNKEWNDALRKRGINPDSVKSHRGTFAADIGLAPVGHRERIVSPAYKNKDFYEMPIAGIYAYIDITDKKVLKVIDTGKGYDKPTAVSYFDGKKIVPDLQAPKPIVITQPEGTNYRIEGNQIISPFWKFRFGIHNREGLVISDVQYYDHAQKKWRYIMYRGGLAEMIVNYGSPDLLNAANNYFDVGVYRLFQNVARPLTYGADAPENATYLPSTLHNEWGSPLKSDSSVAVFEEYGGVLWRHENHSRKATNLAIKYYITAGNYDYGFKWIFKEDGVIVVETELNGYPHVRAVNRTQDITNQPDETHDGNYYGTIVEPHVEANNHQHWFVYRFDLDVDGQQNSVGEMNTSAVPRSADNPLGSTLVAKTTMFTKEKEAQRDANIATNRSWMVMNHHVMNKYGHHSSYMLMPTAGITPLPDRKSSLFNRAEVLYHHFWATPYSPDEMYPAGDYPTTKQKGQGLPEWSKQNRNIDNTDVVVWYVGGVTHIVRPEEWPIMNQHSVAVHLMPMGFMSANPVLGMPASKPVSKK
jgi:primary-amine oxidase